MSYPYVPPPLAVPEQQSSGMLAGLGRLVTKPVASGLVGFVGAKMLMEPGVVPVLGVELDQAIVYGLVIGGASAINSATKEVTMPLLGIQDPLSRMAQMVAAPALTGAATVGVGVVANAISGAELLPSPKGALNSFLLGAGSEVVGSYAVQWIQ